MPAGLYEIEGALSCVEILLYITMDHELECLHTVMPGYQTTRRIEFADANKASGCLGGKINGEALMKRLVVPSHCEIYLGNVFENIALQIRLPSLNRMLNSITLELYTSSKQ
ncbi:hypothetical protein RSAG8_08561, partial [Rhizoctonia solani AG-8 WAC10335]